MSAYDQLASGYDALMRDGEYEKRAAWLNRRLKKHRLPVETVLDLACGTGTISCLLAEQGYQVTATDGSIEMLTQAMMKAEMLGEQAPLFVHQTMQRTALPQPVDAVISTMDSLNYLTAMRDLKETFRRVWKNLKPGGLFLFDVNTPDKFRRMDCQLYTDESEDSYAVWRTFYSEKTGICTYQVDLFRLLEDETWERSYEEHRERGWSVEELTEALREAGFENIRQTGDMTNSPAKPGVDRWNFYCVK